MAKLIWEISRPGYFGIECTVTAPTRAAALGIAESQFLAERAWEEELVGQADEDGIVFARSPIPEFVARKLGRH